jgi:hypothetical protein
MCYCCGAMVQLHAITEGPLCSSSIEEDDGDLHGGEVPNKHGPLMMRACSAALVPLVGRGGEGRKRSCGYSLASLRG